MKTLYVWQCGEPRTFKEGECEISVRYDIRAAADAGHDEHPVKVMCELGFAWDAAVPESIGNCWFFRVKEMVAEKAVPDPIGLQVQALWIAWAISINANVIFRIFAYTKP